MPTPTATGPGSPPASRSIVRATRSTITSGARSSPTGSRWLRTGVAPSSPNAAARRFEPPRSMPIWIATPSVVPRRPTRPKAPAGRTRVGGAPVLCDASRVLAATGSSELDEVTAEINYSIDTGVKPLDESYGPGNVHSRKLGALDPRRVRIRNGRPLAGQLALERNGFVLVDHATQVADFFDRPQIVRHYYPEVEALVARVSGARRVVAFDHTVRSGAELAEREAKQLQEPVAL